MVEMSIPLASLGISRLPEPGVAWRGNFCRSGKSCGGLSSWVPTGGRFFTPSLFGLFLNGTERDYLVREIAAVSARFPNLPEVREAADRLQDSLKSKRNVSGLEFEKFLQQVERLRRFAVKQHNAGKKMLVWHHSPWSSFGPDLRIPVTDELRELKLTVPRGARAIGSFIVSNLTDMPNMFCNL